MSDLEAELLDGIRECLRNPPPPCGTKKRPHLVHPKSQVGKLTHCASCGETWVFEGFTNGS